MDSRPHDCPPTQVFILVGYANSIRNDHARSLRVVRPWVMPVKLLPLLCDPSGSTFRSTRGSKKSKRSFVPFRCSAPHYVKYQLTLRLTPVQVFPSDLCLQYQCGSEINSENPIQRTAMDGKWPQGAHMQKNVNGSSAFGAFFVFCIGDVRMRGTERGRATEDFWNG